MAFELHEGSLKGITGKFYEDPVFKITTDELNEFEKQFPHKEKHFTNE
ncbi:hypothetical protein [Vallitalea guaymasensis]|uniref:Uncharacterized protein n=1 Tax=Vallitalea guaymasensis TaxID=1185412 RepID=A0A8J8SAH0_9FIRM|nr:hypothetical protein [Vallitalea guaymasensis]QUH27728.1 hypothetical protein HYG85_01865 [Vallitalea guaymasensis]